MIRQGILVFENTPEGARLAATRVAGLSLLERGIRTLARAGIEHLVVILPPGAPIALGRFTRQLELRLEFLFWGRDCTLPLEPSEDFLVVLGDYVHHHSSLSGFSAAGLRGRAFVALGGERSEREDSIYAAASSSGAVEFSRTQAPNSRLSAGAFLCAAGLFTPAELAASTEEIWTFLSRKSRGRKSTVVPSSTPSWRRVRDRRSARAAKKMLFDQVTKKTSAYISRHLNAHISIPISKLLVETGLSPHAVTLIFVLSTGLAAAGLLLYARSYAGLLLAGTLWQLAAILDRCDGEIARIKLCESRFGAWFDTVTDNIAYFFFYLGIIAAMHHRHPETLLHVYLGIAAFGAIALTLGVLYGYALKTGSGSLQNYMIGYVHHVPRNEKGLIYKIMERLEFTAHRDFFSFFFFAGVLLGLFELMYWFFVGGVHLFALTVLVSQRKMLHWYKKSPEAAPFSEEVLDTRRAPVDERG